MLPDAAPITDPGTNFIEHYECRGTMLIGASNLSPVTKLVAGTGAVSPQIRSKPENCQDLQKFICVQMRALSAVASAEAGVRVQEPLQS